MSGTLVNASHFLVGNREVELIPNALSSLLLSTFLLFLLFSFVLILLYSSIVLLVTGLRYSSYELVLRLLPPERLPCVATLVVGEAGLVLK